MAEILTDNEKEKLKERVKVVDHVLIDDYNTIKHFYGFIKSMLAISACVAGFYAAEDIMQNKTAEAAQAAVAAFCLGTMAYAGHKRCKNSFEFGKTERMWDVLRWHMTKEDNEFLDSNYMAEETIRLGATLMNMATLFTTSGCYGFGKLTDAQAFVMSLACMGAVGIATEHHTAGKLKTKKEFLNSRLSQICSQRAH